MRTLVISLTVVLAAVVVSGCGCKKPQPAEPTAPGGPAVAVDAGGAVTPTPTPTPTPEPATGARTPLLAPGSENYDRFEGTSFQNACGSDSDCVTGGCSGEVCAAEPVTSTCDVQPTKPAGKCGCVDGLCVWYK